MQHKSYSLIIRCYNEENHIGRLLAGVMEQTIKPKEIIVVDSGSTDATLSIVSRFPIKIVRISKDEFSFGRALNVGCQTATTPIIIIASAHVYPIFNNWAEKMLLPFNDEKVGLVYGKQRGHELSHFSERQIMKKWFPDFPTQQEQKYPFCNNANSAIRKDLWQIYPFDEELTGLEDLDWAKKIARAGYGVRYQPESEIVHVHEESFRKIFTRYYREGLAMKNIYQGEKFGKRDFFFLFVSNVLSDIIVAFKERKLFKNLRNILLFRLMQFTGTFRGFRDGKEKIVSLRRRLYYPHLERSKVSSDQSLGNRIDYSKIKEIINS